MQKAHLARHSFVTFFSGDHSIYCNKKLQNFQERLKKMSKQNCGCGGEGKPSFVPTTLAAAFVVPQIGGDTFEPMQGLKNGTIYPELYMPYVPRRQRDGKK